MSLSLGLLAAYFAGGMKYMMDQEGWDAADAFYFWCMTVSTVGYGDLAPTTPKTQAFVSVYAIVGLVLVWSIVSDYYGVVQGKLQDFQAKLLSLVGIELVDVHALPIDKHTPDQVNAKVKYWRRYILALLPMVTLLALFVALHFVRKESSFTEAVYFGVVTATTVGFGDFGFLEETPQNKCLAALGVMGVVVVFALIMYLNGACYLEDGHVRRMFEATLALGTKVGGALCLSGVRPDQCAVLERLYAPYYDVAEKTFRDPDAFGREYWGSWARMILTRKEADRRELLERISDGAIM
mgnify:CR=1 FL=1